MSQVKQYRTLLAEIRAVADWETMSPCMTAEQVWREAVDLRDWSMNHEDAFDFIGCDRQKALAPVCAAEALLEAELRWHAAAFQSDAARQKWLAQEPHWFYLRNRLVQAMRFAYRPDAGLHAEVSRLLRGSCYGDIVRDLGDMARLAIRNLAPLARIGFDLGLVYEAASCSEEIAFVLSFAVRNAEAELRARAIRNKAFTLAIQRMGELRAAIEFLFPERSPAGALFDHLQAPAPILFDQAQPVDSLACA